VPRGPSRVRHTARDQRIADSTRHYASASRRAGRDPVLRSVAISSAKLYDVVGRLVAEVQPPKGEAGWTRMEWDAGAMMGGRWRQGSISPGSSPQAMKPRFGSSSCGKEEHEVDVILECALAASLSTLGVRRLPHTMFQETSRRSRRRWTLAGRRPVLVAPGLHELRFHRSTFHGRAVALQSEGGAEMTILEPADGGSSSGSIPPRPLDTRIQGFTLRASEHFDGPPWAWLSGSAARRHVTVVDCVVAGNEAIGTVGAGSSVSVSGGTLRMINCTVAANRSDHREEDWRAPRGSGGDAVLERCIVYGNCGIDIDVSSGSSLTLECCIVGDVAGR